MHSYWLTKVLPLGCFDKLVYGIISIRVTWIDSLILKEYRLLCIVANINNVPYRVVGIVQALHLAARLVFERRLDTIIDELGSWT